MSQLKYFLAQTIFFTFIGSYGSLQFIRKFLAPNFLKKGVTIQGAFILDTIMNVDFMENSQDVPEDWTKIVPGAADSIIKDQYKYGLWLKIIFDHFSFRVVDKFQVFHFL